MLAGDNSILSKSTEAKIASEKAEAKEQARIDIMAWITDKISKNEDSTLDDSKIKEILTGKPYVKLADTTSFTTKKGEYVIPYSELYLSTDFTPSDSTYTVYTLGQEVTVGGEHFYVITKNDNATKDRVTLLSKYNLNVAGTNQAVNASLGDTACAFASNKYWEAAYNAYTEWDTKELDLNVVSGNIQGDAITKAQSYAIEKGGEGTIGRLLSHEEAEDLKNQNETMANIIWGKANQQGENSDKYCLYYWLSSIPYDNGTLSDGVWEVNDGEFFRGLAYSFPLSFGVRPVIEISKSKIAE